MINYKDKNIKEIIDKIFKTSNIKNFCEEYSQKTISEIDWIAFCDDVQRFKCFKFGFYFFLELLKKNLYKGSYQEELYNHIDTFEELKKISHAQYSIILCKDKIKYLIIHKNTTSDAFYSYSFIESNNDYIKKEFLSFLNTYNTTDTKWLKKEFIYDFENSFDEYKDSIKTYTDFNANTMFKQLDYYKSLYKNNKQLLGYMVIGVIRFYRYLVKTYSEYSFFENSICMTEQLLFSNTLKQYILNDYSFMIFNPNNHPGAKDKICFIIKGYEDISTRVTDEHYICIDISIIKNTRYKNILWNFILSSASTILNVASSQIFYIVDCLNFLLEMKNQKDYPNKNLNYFNNQESILIRNYIYNMDVKISTRNNKIGAIRRFLLYTQTEKYFEFDDMFFDYLRQYEEPIKNNAVSIKDDDLILINNKILEKAKTDLYSKSMYVIFHLLLQTEFRINQICHLKIDCLEPSIKQNQYYIKTNAKSSHGKLSHYVISELTYKLLMNHIEDTEKLRDECDIESNKDYIFLYKSTNTIKIITDGLFGKYLRNICNELNIKNNYNASNLRDTHMTKSFEHILRTGKSNVELNVLSGHKYVDTTHNHYIEIELEKMLESTYGIIIGEDIEEKVNPQILDKIPKELDNDYSSVNNNCGKCNIDDCIATSNYHCLTCKHFITTVQHEPYFKKQIEIIDELIKNTNFEYKHDLEDLNTKKELYLVYLKEIYKHKEKAND